MSATTSLPGGPTTGTSGAGRRLGLVARCAPTEDGTQVTVLDSAGRGCEVTIAEGVDRMAAGHLTSSFRHLTWARLALGAHGPRGHVNGVRHRLPITIEVSAATVLALAGQGVPTLVVTD